MKIDKLTINFCSYLHYHIHLYKENKCVMFLELEKITNVVIQVILYYVF